MEVKKKREPERDEKGRVILKGARTFGRATARNKNRARNRAHDLKSQATDRLVKLMQQGPQADRLTRSPSCIKGTGKVFASKRAMFKSIYKKTEQLKEKKERLEKDGSHFLVAIVKSDIEVHTEILRELYKEIQDENIPKRREV